MSFRYDLESLEGCCGILVLYDMCALRNSNGKPSMSLTKRNIRVTKSELQSIIDELNEDANIKNETTAVLASTIPSQNLEIKWLKALGFKQIGTTKNVSTRRTITLWQRDLTVTKQKTI